jgi:hypothetical protein
MILYSSYEEARGLRLGVRSFLSDETHGMCTVVAPPAQRSSRAGFGAIINCGMPPR